MLLLQDFLVLRLLRKERERERKSESGKRTTMSNWVRSPIEYTVAREGKVVRMGKI